MTHEGSPDGRGDVPGPSSRRSPATAAPTMPPPFTTPRPATWATTRLQGAALLMWLLAVTVLVIAVTSDDLQAVGSAVAFAVAGACAWPSADAPAVPGRSGRRAAFGAVRAVAAVLLCFAGVLLAIP